MRSRIEVTREQRKHDARVKGGFNDWRIGVEDIGPRPKTCQWIERDPRVDVTKCGDSVKPGSAWCAAHHARVWRRHDPAL